MARLLGGIHSVPPSPSAAEGGSGECAWDLDSLPLAALRTMQAGPLTGPGGIAGHPGSPLNASGAQPRLWDGLLAHAEAGPLPLPELPPELLERQPTLNGVHVKAVLLATSISAAYS